MYNLFTEDFANRPPFKNYMYLLYQILFQIKTDKDYFEKYGNTVKNEIIFYILEMKSNMIYHRFLWRIRWLLPILKDKVTDQDYGFGGEEGGAGGEVLRLMMMMIMMMMIVIKIMIVG